MRKKWKQTLKWTAYSLIGWLVLWSVTQQLKIPDPISWSWWQALRDLQTGIGAAIGLTAIVAGAILNAALVRRRDDRLRDEERKSLAAALAGEIDAIVAHEKQLLRATEGEIDANQTNAVFFDRVEKIFSVPRDTRVYQSSLSKTGLLTPELAGDTIDFYAFFERANKATALAVDPNLSVKDRIDQILDIYEKILCKVPEGEDLAKRLKDLARG